MALERERRTASSPEQNKEMVRHYVAAFNRGDAETLRTLFTKDAKIQGVLGDVGMDDALGIWSELHAAFRIQLIVDSIVAEGDTVAARYTERGVFAGPFRGEHPTGKNYELVAMEWFSFRDGLIQRRWGARDSASQRRQLGME